MHFLCFCFVFFLQFFPFWYILIDFVSLEICRHFKDLFQFRCKLDLTFKTDTRKIHAYSTHRWIISLYKKTKKKIKFCAITTNKNTKSTDDIDCFAIGTSEWKWLRILQSDYSIAQCSIVQIEANKTVRSQLSLKLW